jgi:hypothetical protein
MYQAHLVIKQLVRLLVRLVFIIAFLEEGI